MILLCRPHPVDRAVFLALTTVLIAVSNAPAQPAEGNYRSSSITDTSIRWPGWDEVFRVLTLQDHNTRVVVLGTMVLGMGTGLIGVFMLLRRRALLADALSHATLPGIALAFMVMVAMGGTGKSLPGLLLGALVTGSLGVGCILLIRRYSRIKEDAALGVVLSVFFGAGVALMGVVQRMRTGHAAGLESFIYGKTASMLTSDALMILVSAVVVIVVCALLYKEFALLCFDQGYARSQGWPVVLLDVVMMTLVVGVTVIGLQAVGLILIIALLVIPPAAARFWTHHLSRTLQISAAVGGVSGLFGAALSALVPRLPAGAVIVMVAGAFFVVSMLFGPARGLLWRLAEHIALKREVERQHLLRAFYECTETAADASRVVSVEQLQANRSWSRGELNRVIAWARRIGLVEWVEPCALRLTDAGKTRASRLVRNHRLWELYLITHAEIAPSHVDRDADQIEHVLGTELVKRLESLLADADEIKAVPASPHLLESATAGTNAGGRT